MDKARSGLFKHFGTQPFRARQPFLCQHHRLRLASWVVHIPFLKSRSITSKSKPFQDRSPSCNVKSKSASTQSSTWSVSTSPSRSEATYTSSSRRRTSPSPHYAKAKTWTPHMPLFIVSLVRNCQLPFLLYTLMYCVHGPHAHARTSDYRPGAFVDQ